VLSSCILDRFWLALLALPPVPTHGSPLRTVLYGSGGASLLAAIAWSRSRLEPPPVPVDDSPFPPLPRFMAASIVAMALAGLSPLLGFVLVASRAGSAAEYLAFGAGGFLVLTLVILPRGLAYWSAWEAAETRSG